MENTNSKKKMSSAKQKKKRVRKAFRIAGEILAFYYAGGDQRKSDCQ